VTQVPPELAGHVVLSGGDGELSTTPEELSAMVRALTIHGKGVLHFHGGLVSEEKGLAVARELLPAYQEAGAYPMFFVWRSDIVSVLRGNLEEIAKEEIFQRLLKKVLSYAAGKVREELGGARGPARGPAGGLLPESPVTVDEELDRREREEEPFAELPTAEDVPELTDAELAEFGDEIAVDDELLANVEVAVRRADPDAEPVGSRGGVTRTQASATSLMDPDAIAELQSRPGGAPSRFGFETAALVKKAVKVLVAVIRRHRSGRWHGLYATVVEEILREFYLANAGATIWATMKRDTLDTFTPGDKPRGGERFLAELARALPAQDTPAITLVGHSTGAVFINNLLGAVDKARAKGNGGLPADFRFRNVVFLAPACTFTDFARVVERRDHLWQRFRMFTMTDDAERADRVFSFVYPHSLLYLVSGLFERDAKGGSEGGKPLIGLERWCKGTEDQPKELPAVRALLQGDAESVAWSPGALSGAIRHGDFDNDPLVKESLKRLIAEP